MSLELSTATLASRNEWNNIEGTQKKENVSHISSVGKSTINLRLRRNSHDHVVI